MAPQQKPGRSRQDYHTPPAFLDAVRWRLGIDDFDIDLAASAENAICARFYTEQDDALVQPWICGDGWNWLNPPFAHIEPWVQRAWYQSRIGAKTAVLVPAGVGANWWARWVHHKAYVLLLNGRLSFNNIGFYPKDCVLLLYEQTAKPCYDVWAWRSHDSH